nr:Protein R05H10.7 [Haemonchus contortus]
MLRRCLYRIHGVRKYNQKVDPSTAFDFIPASSVDIKDIVDLCANEFILDEPHSKALNITPDASRSLFEYIVAKALHHPYSYRVHEKGTDRLIGIRLLSVGHRDHKLDIEPIPFKESDHPGARRLCDILAESKEIFWKWADPGIQKVIRREITYVSPIHQRKGIAKYLLHLGLDFDDLKKKGFHGITSEASSLANQKLLESSGYVCIGRPEYKLQMHDGNEGVMVFFKDLR